MVTNIKSEKAIMNDYDKFGKLIIEKVNSYIEGLDQIEFHKYLNRFIWGCYAKTKINSTDMGRERRGKFLFRYLWAF